MPIFGVSGSPILNGNTDRIIRALLEQSGKEYTFINLSTLRFDPCRGCAHLCALTNMCPLDDDLKPFFEPIRNSEAIVLGSPVHAGYITGWMFSFVTRLWCFHHVRNLLKDRPMLIVMTGLFEGSGDVAVPKFIELFKSWNETVNVIGHIYYVSHTPPCFKCGMGNVCKVGGLWGMVDRDEERLKNFRVTPDKFKRWEDCPQTVAEVSRYAKVLAKI